MNIQKLRRNSFQKISVRHKNFEHWYKKQHVEEQRNANEPVASHDWSVVESPCDPPSNLMDFSGTELFAELLGRRFRLDVLPGSLRI